MTRPKNMFWLGLFGLLLAPNLAHGIEYLLAMSADNAGAANTSTIRSIALDNTYAITNQKSCSVATQGQFPALPPSPIPSMLQTPPRTSTATPFQAMVPGI